MRSLRSIPRPLLLTFAILFAVPLVIYTAVWIYYAGWSPPVQIGIEPEREIAPYVAIKRVFPRSPADRAGLRAQDRILTVDGYPQHGMALAPAVARGKPGDVVSLVVQRPGVKDPITVTLTLEAAPPRNTPTFAQSIAIRVLDCYPLPFLVVGLLVLFRAPRGPRCLAARAAVRHLHRSRTGGPARGRFFPAATALHAQLHDCDLCAAARRLLHLFRNLSFAFPD